MIKFDFWYCDTLKDVEAVTCTFYPNNMEYRGNLYKEGKAIGDYTATNSAEIEKYFPGLFRD